MPCVASRAVRLPSPVALPVRPKSLSCRRVATLALETRRLGDSDLFVSCVGLGTMTFGERNSYEESAWLLSVAGACFDGMHTTELL